MEKLYAFLGRISAKMKGNRFTNWLRSVIVKIGLFDLIRELVIGMPARPTEEMKQRAINERRLFSEHARELKEVYDSLEDERSKTVFENILKFRATGKGKFLKKSCNKVTWKNQYLVPELEFSDSEVIVDCGAFIGDTAELFYKEIPGCRVISLEPDENNFESLQKLELPGLKCIKAGAWSEDTTLSFDDNGRSDSGKVSDSGSTKIEVKALDNLPECRSATYIKMDIEGAELAALKGAEKIIRENRPKLAVCLYHNPQDLFEIPLYIKELNPDYKLFVYHHNVFGHTETVLYAV